MKCIAGNNDIEALGAERKDLSLTGKKLGTIARFFTSYAQHFTADVDSHQADRRILGQDSLEQRGSSTPDIQ